MLAHPGAMEGQLLIALGIGYIVLYFAKREEKDLQFLGYIIGTVVIVIAAVYLLSGILLQLYKVYPKSHCYGAKMQRMMQPMYRAPAQRR